MKKTLALRIRLWTLLAGLGAALASAIPEAAAQQGCPGPDGRASTILVIDQSSSMNEALGLLPGASKGPRWNFVRTKSSEILEKAIATKRPGLFAIIFFNDGIRIGEFQLPEEAAAAREALKDGLDRGPEGATALNAAVFQAIQLANSELDRGSLVNLVVVSDGVDQANENVRRFDVRTRAEGYIYEQQIRVAREECERLILRVATPQFAERLRFHRIWLGGTEAKGTEAKGTEAKEEWLPRLRPAPEVSIQLSDPEPGPFDRNGEKKLGLCLSEGPFSLPWPDSASIGLVFEPASDAAPASLNESSAALRKDTEPVSLKLKGDPARGTRGRIRFSYPPGVRGTDGVDVLVPPQEQPAAKGIVRVDGAPRELVSNPVKFKVEGLDPAALDKVQVEWRVDGRAAGPKLQGRDTFEMKGSTPGTFELTATVSQNGKANTTTVKSSQTFVELGLKLRGPPGSVWPGDPTDFLAELKGDPNDIVQAAGGPAVRWLILDPSSGKESTAPQTGRAVKLTLDRPGKYQVSAAITPAVGSRRKEIRSESVEVVVEGGFPVLLASVEPARAGMSVSAGGVVQLKSTLTNPGEDQARVTGVLWQWRQTRSARGASMEGAWQNIPPAKGTADALGPRDWTIPDKDPTDLLEGGEIEVRGRIVPDRRLAEQLQKQKRGEIVSKPQRLTLDSAIAQASIEYPGSSDALVTDTDQRYSCLIRGGPASEAGKAIWEAGLVSEGQAELKFASQSTNVEASPNDPATVRFSNRLTLRNAAEGAKVRVRVKLLDKKGNPLRIAGGDANGSLEWVNEVQLAPVQWRVSASIPGKSPESAFDFGAEFDLRIEPAEELEAESARWNPDDGLEQIGKTSSSTRWKSTNFSGPRKFTVEFRRKGSKRVERQEVTIEVRRVQPTLRLEAIETVQEATSMAPGLVKVRGAAEGAEDVRIVVVEKSNPSREHSAARVERAGPFDQTMPLPAGNYTLSLSGTKLGHRAPGDAQPRSESFSSNSRDHSIKAPEVSVAVRFETPSIDPSIGAATPPVIWTATNALVNPEVDRLNGFWVRSLDHRMPSPAKPLAEVQGWTESQLREGPSGWAALRTGLEREGFQWRGAQNLDLKSTLAADFEGSGEWSNGQIEVIAIAAGAGTMFDVDSGSVQVAFPAPRATSNLGVQLGSWTRATRQLSVTLQEVGARPSGEGLKSGLYMRTVRPGTTPATPLPDVHRAVTRPAASPSEVQAELQAAGFEWLGDQAQTDLSPRITDEGLAGGRLEFIEVVVGACDRVKGCPQMHVGPPTSVEIRSAPRPVLAIVTVGVAALVVMGLYHLLSGNAPRRWSLKAQLLLRRPAGGSGDTDEPMSGEINLRLNARKPKSSSQPWLGVSWFWDAFSLTCWDPGQKVLTIKCEKLIDLCRSQLADQYASASDGVSPAAQAILEAGSSDQIEIRDSPQRTRKMSLTSINTPDARHLHEIEDEFFRPASKHEVVKYLAASQSPEEARGILYLRLDARRTDWAGQALMVASVVASVLLAVYLAHWRFGFA